MGKVWNGGTRSPGDGWVGHPQVEYNVNDGFEPHYCKALPCKLEYGGLNTQLRRSYERLLRKLLMLPHRPAVIMLQTFDYSERQGPRHPRLSLGSKLRGPPRPGAAS